LLTWQERRAARAPLNSTLRTTPIPRLLDDTYRRRAIPPGTVRFWSWLFAAADARAPLLGIYALLAEWRALTDPGTEVGVAQLKLAWWREEVHRLTADAPLHPITSYLSALSRASAVDFTPLIAAVEAIAAQIGGVPIERSVDLEAHADAMLGRPLLIVAQLSGDRLDEASRRACTSALAAADYLARAIAGYRREAVCGRLPFAVDELLASGIENADLLALTPPRRLQEYLARLRTRAARYYESAVAALPGVERPQNRHLLVLATLGARQLAAPRPLSDPGPRDVYSAWRAARRAASGK
jgi:phytoene synthase